MSVIKQLNNFKEDHLLYLFDHYRESIARTEKLFPEQDDKSISYHFIMEDAIRLGLVSYVLNKKIPIVRNHLNKTLDACVNLFAQDKSRFHTPIALYDGLCLALALDRWDDAMQLAGKIDFPPGEYDDGSFSVDEVIINYIVALGKYLLGESKQALKIAKENIDQHKKRDELFVKEFIAYSAALAAIIEKNEPAFHEALLKAVDIHAYKAQEGNLQSDPRAFICLRALAIANVGVKNGFSIPFESDYLPATFLIN